MDAVTVALGVGLAIVCVWSSVLYLLQLIRIEELEAELRSCEVTKNKVKLFKGKK